MRNYYSDPTGNTAIGAVDKEIRILEKKAEKERKLKKQRARRLRRYALARAEAYGEEGSFEKN
ncbi:MAG: hypothetical protein E7647_09020 [Ruminococcaceae bacterium]|nr:hypothetical protein [Oscillospiraceae bacterium]